nr:phage portal protein [uncultured Cohaesibacter sp.]
MKHNLIDRALGYFSPETGLKRARARLLLDGVRRYDGGQHTRDTADWNAQNTSANAEIAHDLVTLRARSRELVRNNPFAQHAQEVFINNTASPNGLLPQLSGSSYDDFMLWSDDCDPERVSDFAGIEGLIAGAVWESGEALVRPIVRKRSAGLHVPLQLQVIEPDYIDHSKSTDLPNGARVVNGIEYDAEGLRVAYWLFRDHPGNIGLLSRFGHQSVRVPASEILHIFNRKRPGQVHGVPAMASSLISWRNVSSYENAVEVRKKIEACMTAFVTGGDGDLVREIASSLGTSPDSFNVLSKLIGPDLVGMLEPGAIVALPGGDLKVDSFAPQASNDTEFLNHKFRGLAAGAGVTEMQLTGDMSKANYSSMRGGLIEARLGFRKFQKHVLAHQLVRPVVKRVFGIGKLAGRFEGLADRFRPDMIWPVFESVDPLKDVMADLIEVRSGFATPQQKMAERGNDFERSIQEVLNFVKAVDKEGLVFDSDPRRVTKTGVANDFGLLGGSDTEG